MSAPSVVIVGGGPAGLSAAVAAAQAGMAVTVIDERPHPGGRLRFDRCETADLAGLLAACQQQDISIRSSTIAWGLFPGWKIPLETPHGAEVLESEYVILATGSIDRGLAFDGNGLPGVMTGSGLRRVIGEFGVLPGKRVFVLGDGPDGAATAHAVRTAGGSIVALVSEDDARSISVQGENGVERVVMNGREYPADIVAVAVGRQPDVQLATMGGHSLVWMPGKGGWSPHQHAEEMHIPTGLFVAGDAAGCDNVDICALDGAYTASRLAASLGLISDDDVAAIAAQLIERRPDRMDYLGTEPLHRQPWQVPLEVNS